MSLFDYCAVIWCPNMNQFKIIERLHSKFTLSVSNYLHAFVILYWNVDVFTLLYKFTKFCIEFLLLICFIYFTMQKM